MSLKELCALYPHLPYYIVKMRVRRGIPLDQPYIAKPKPERPPKLKKPRARRWKPSPESTAFNAWIRSGPVSVAVI